MNRSALHRLILESDVDELSPEVLQQIAADPEAQRLLERTRAVRDLVALKRYEQRHPSRELVSRQNILRELRQQDAARPSWAERMGAFFDIPAVPALRFGVASLFVALLAIQLFTLPEGPALRSANLEPEPVVEARAQQPLLLASTNISGDRLWRSIFSAGLASTQGAAQVQYGPGPSRVVSFEP